MDKNPRINLTSFVGTWKLISLESRPKNGAVVYPFGEAVQGQLIYTASGRMAAQLMRAGRPRFQDGDPMKGTVEEIEASFRGCGTYYGTYEVNLDGRFVDHHVEGALFPNWEGRAMRRYFEFSGNSLSLTTPPARWGGGDGEVVVVARWERID